MTRSLKKGPFIDHNLFKSVELSVETNSKKPIKTRSRSSTILPVMIGLTISIHNGKVYVPILITEDMVGRKLGEFAMTRTFRKHAGDKKAK